jgi:L-arabinose transport system substrate-binding protein
VTYDELDTARERTDGATARLLAGGLPPERVFQAPQKTTDIPGGFDAMSTLLTRHPEVERWLVCGLNDNAVLGAVRALEGRGRKAQDVIGIGINGTDCITELEKAEPTGFFASVLLMPRQHGHETVSRLHRWVVHGEEPPRDTRTAGILIHRANFRAALAEQGIR